MFIWVFLFLKCPTHLGESEAFREQHDFADLLQIGYDADYGSEERLDTLRKFGSSGVTRIHRDEHTEILSPRDNLALELKLLDAMNNGLLDGENLLRNHGQHLDVDAIKLIETSPGTRLN